MQRDRVSGHVQIKKKIHTFVHLLNSIHTEQTEISTVPRLGIQIVSLCYNIEEKPVRVLWNMHLDIGHYEKPYQVVHTCWEPVPSPCSQLCLVTSPVKDSVIRCWTGAWRMDPSLRAQKINYSNAIRKMLYDVIYKVPSVPDRQLPGHRGVNDVHCIQPCLHGKPSVVPLTGMYTTRSRTRARNDLTLGKWCKMWMLVYAWNL